ncbi:glycosyltransferase family 2 protein [Sediminibacterium sp.]|uniref:glycosyltransferase family 2 protein n=1 Tax=Sediminibacterium sp. TaxID=1917865 RepID=UPI003F70A667
MKVSIIIPVQSLKKQKSTRFFYKSIFGIVETINSITVNPPNIDFEIVVVINGRNDTELIKFISENKSVTRYAILTENVGVARAWNIGAQMATGQFLCFCNDDVEFEKNSFDKLLNILINDEMAGQVGPEGGMWEGITSGKRVGLSHIEEADEISGFFFILTKAIFIKSGGFDIEYTPAGCEEIDMSFKIRQLGYKCLVVPNTGIKHHGHHGISLKNTNISYLGMNINTLDLDKRNKEYFLSKWG